MTTTITQQEHRRNDVVVRLCGRLTGRSDEIEGAGRLPDDIAADLRASGIYRMWLPRELGGSEAEPGAVIAAVEALAAADGSVGWCAAIGLASNLISGYLPRAGAEEMYPTGTEVTGGSLMPGGSATRNANNDLLVDGRWSFASGAHHCDWLAGVAAIDGDPAAEAFLVVIPRAETSTPPTVTSPPRSLPYSTPLAPASHPSSTNEPQPASPQSTPPTWPLTPSKAATAPPVPPPCSPTARYNATSETSTPPPSTTLSATTATKPSAESSSGLTPTCPFSRSGADVLSPGPSFESGEPVPPLELDEGLELLVGRASDVGNDAIGTTCAWRLEQHSPQLQIAQRR